MTAKRASPGEAPGEIHLLASGGRARGTWTVHNHSGEVLDTRDVAVSGCELPGPRGQPVASLRVRGAIEPGAIGDLAVRARVDPHAAPGRYSGEVHIDDRDGAHPLVVDVPAVRRLSFEPARVIVDAAAAPRAEIQVIARNDGNVTEAIGGTWRRAIEPPERLCNTVRAAVSEKVETSGQLLDAMAKALAVSLAAEGVMEASVVDGPVDVPAGREVLVTLGLRIVTRAAARGGRAKFRICGAKLSIEIPCSPHEKG